MARRSSSGVSYTTRFGGRPTWPTKASAAPRPVRRRSRAWVSATTRLVVTTRAPRWMCSRSAPATEPWAGSRRSAIVYHAPVSTKISAGTAAGRPATSVPSPARFLAVGEETVVVASYVVRGTTGLRSVRQADDLQRWMSVRVRCLALEGVEIYLHRLADPSLCAHDRRSCDHEYWS